MQSITADIAQNLILLFALVVTVYSIYSARYSAEEARRNDRKIARRAASIEFLRSFVFDHKYEESVKYLGIWKSQDINPAHFLSSKKVADLKLDVTPYPHCTRYLKILALISQGVDNGIFDDAIFRQYMYSTAIEFHSFLTPLILEFRATAAQRVVEKEHVNSGTAYEEVDRLIERWKDAGYEMKPEHQPWQLKNAPLF